jgi:hypothetical protein
MDHQMMSTGIKTLITIIRLLAVMGFNLTIYTLMKTILTTLPPIMVSSAVAVVWYPTLVMTKWTIIVSYSTKMGM